jgi:hypothetical protein
MNTLEIYNYISQTFPKFQKDKTSLAYRVALEFDLTFKQTCDIIYEWEQYNKLCQ